jgi:hypothetical protein
MWRLQYSMAFERHYDGCVDVIICDIDGTVLDVTRRIAKSLEEIGVPPTDQPLRVADTIPRNLRSRFYDVFLSEKYAGLDEPVFEIIQAIGVRQRSVGLPVVYLSGRPEGMRRATETALSALDLPYKEIVLRPKRQQMMRTTEFKVQTVKDKHYEPRVVYDDDPGILAAFRAAFSGAELHLVRGPQVTPWLD